MEANESSGLTNSYSSYPSHHHHHHHHHQSPPQQPLQQQTPPSSQINTATHQASASNGGVATSDGGGASLYPPSVAGKAPSVEPQRRKRGRPRKYSTPEAAAAAKRAAVPAAVKRVERQYQVFGGGGGGGSSHSSSSSSKKSNFASVGGQGFTPHVINVAAGEDVNQKIILFMQQAKRELCILSASGSIASAALRQPATSGGSIAYQGRFDIVSLTGSYVRSDQGGKAGGLSACLSSENGQIVGGGVCGPLVAAGPVEVIIATFLVYPKKDFTVGFKGDISGSAMPSPVSASPAIYRPLVDSSSRGGFTLTGSDDHQSMDGNAFMMQSQWRSGLNYDLAGNTVNDSHDSPENGDYEQIPD
ncbi:hypothetical protein RND81_04G193800 [Saponaria officinalis]|uniref:AT-hook motif nuclear-localized protein n=1 Tax=Saponaria officinalis TaxID=3572 RepID=A0AAW1LNR0_SAPOF